MPHLAGRRRQQCSLAIRHACFFIYLWVPIALAGSPTENEYFARFDTDADGRVSLDEYQHYLSHGFAQMDRNGDGRINEDEWPLPGSPALTLQHHLANLADVFSRQDSDCDGYLDLAELLAPPR